ncbi:MAG: twin-arginine translocation signal domain-containing protein [Spirochaetaceae bacterium]|nr:MAG: twin-arginine translocation signal domain-containing protein [Spirochaetaceae bacterium]
MKRNGLSRREFLRASAAAAAAGAAGSFVLQGCARQETEIEPYRTDETLGGERFSYCGVCSANCAMIGHVAAGRLVQLRGNPDDQVGRGKLCVKGYSAIKDLYDPDRLKYPMMRTEARKGPGIDPKWVKVSWEEALQTTADGFNDAIESHGPETVAFFSRGHDWMNRLRDAIGTPNHLMHHSTCFTTHTAVWRACLGMGNRPFMLDIARAKYLLSFGWDMPSKAKNMSARDYVAALSDGAKSVVVDPRLTVTGTMADEWIPIKPGTDLAFMLAMIRIIVNEELYDAELVESTTYGLDRLRAQVQDYTPQWASGITGIDAAVITRVAREFATTRPALIPNHKRDAGGPNYSNSWRAAHCMVILNAMVGAIDHPGGQIVPRRPYLKPFNAVFPPPEFPKPRTERIDGFEKHPIVGPTRRGDFSTVTDALLTGKPYPIKAALFRKHNVLAFPDATRFVEALKKIDFIAVCDVWPSEMVQMADVVFPEPYFLETSGFGDRDYHEFYPQIALRQPMVPPLYDTRGYGGIISGIADAMGLGHIFEGVSSSTLWDEQLKAMGTSWQELNNSPNGLWSDEKPFVPTTEFKTPSGKIELYSTVFEEHGYDPLPLWQEKRELPSDQYPFYMLISRPPMHKMSQTQNNELMAQTYLENAVIMNRDRARQLGLEQGRQVYVESRAGRIRLKLQLEEGIRPDCVCIEHGFGHWSPSLSIAHQKGANEGDLIPHLSIEEMVALKDPGAGACMTDFCVSVRSA